MNSAFNLFNSTYFSLNSALSVAILNLLIIIKFVNGNCGSRKLISSGEMEDEIPLSYQGYIINKYVNIT